MSLRHALWARMMKGVQRLRGLRGCHAAVAVVGVGLAVAGLLTPIGFTANSWAQDTATSKLPSRPDDPRAVKAYVVLDTYCARCHQSGKLDKPVAAGGLGNILALAELAGDSRLITPGVPDDSLLYQVLANGHAPLDVFGSGAQMQGPEPDDIIAVRQWVREMPSRTQRCGGRQPISTAEVDGWIEEALRVERDGARNLRFISLVNLHNGCMPSAQIAAARQAMSKLLNTLSWAPEPQAVRSVDPNGTLLAFSLDDLGWDAAQWEKLVRAYSKALVMPLSDKSRRLAGSTVPIVRGDWLAYAASHPKLYYQLLNVPEKLGDLAKKNGIDLDYDVRVVRARRAIVRDSTVTRANRLIERHPGARGGFWLSYDFTTSTGEQDLFNHPLGPQALGSKVTGSARAPFKPDGVRVMFTLPNGFLAYAIYDAAGNRIDKIPPGIEVPGFLGANPQTSVGAGCLSCHTGGVKIVRDAYRAHAATLSGPAPSSDPANGATPGTSPPAAPPVPEPPAPLDETVQAALQLAATDGELLLLSNSDNERYRNAMIAAGVDLALKFEGGEVISGLARRYLMGTDYDGAAAELDLTPQTFTAALANAHGETALLARRLQQRRLPRADIDKIFAYLKGVESADAVPSVQPPDKGAKIGLEIWLDKADPASGDLIVINAQSDTNCYLTVTNVDAGGRATVIFPNDFEPDNLLSAGKPRRVPSAEAPFQLRHKAEGRELIIAQCSTSAAPPMGIEHEFGRQRFTVLGDWENYVEDALVTEADLRKSPEKAARARRARTEAMRRDRGAAASGDRADTSPGRSLADGLAVLVLK